MFECSKIGCKELVEPDKNYKQNQYCQIHEKELQDKAMKLYGSDLPPTILVSGGSIRYVPSSCERCNMRFRMWRKCYHVFDRVYKKFLFVCKDCRKMTDIK